MGDNLGLNSTFGFVESFKANHFCRICKTSSEKSKMLLSEEESMLRTRSNYEEDVALSNLSKTGIKERCAFHKIENFHITENLSVDMMHDLLEGVCKYVLRSIIHKYIFEKKYFTLEMLNGRIENFDFGSEGINKPPTISINH